jgi:dihydroxyacetone kinase phosphotransfer subunit
MISLIILSHSEKIAAGAAELAREMARGVTIVPVGGTKDGSLGANYEAAKEAILSAIKDGEALVLFDIGSTLMTCQMILDELDDAEREKTRLVSAALVEGAVIGAVNISIGMSLDEAIEGMRDVIIAKM